ncbi:N-acetyltransferase [Kurthia sibirica]|uniref:N-acetyltransferase n=1 Tax=Kurthia sibirica TaxID=202750 RepID=A0A2U3ANZ7_9BACL|nr:N-acetyltransferase [Kurthia sibirica]PWI26236.1 N-acetyltransferase [Kurthia sibirica]GEK33849.1 acetoin utilization protein AcuA [Kurthia sibirica]
MEHIRTFYSNTVHTPRGEVIVEGPILSSELETMTFHEDLCSFRVAPQQYEAILGISKLPEGRIIVCRQDRLIVGYTTFVYPDPLERWSEGKMDNLIELGAIEVINDFRGAGLGKEMLRLSMLDDAMEDYIVITTEYYWHWDLKRTGLSVWDYRKVMEKMMNAGGLEYYATDDPEICSHPANCLMARIGKRVDQESIERFDRLRFMNRLMY